MAGEFQGMHEPDKNSRGSCGHEIQPPERLPNGHYGPYGDYKRVCPTVQPNAHTDAAAVKAGLVPSLTLTGNLADVDTQAQPKGNEISRNQQPGGYTDASGSHVRVAQQSGPVENPRDTGSEPDEEDERYEEGRAYLTFMKLEKKKSD